MRKRTIQLIAALVAILMFAACDAADLPDEPVDEPDDEPDTYCTEEDLELARQKNDELEAFYLSTAATAVENGWENEKKTVEQLNIAALFVEAVEKKLDRPDELKRRELSYINNTSTMILDMLGETAERVAVPYEKPASAEAG